VEASERVVQSTPERAAVEESALALAAAGIPHRVEAVPGGWRLLVAAGDAAAGAAVLDACARDVRDTAPVPAVPDAGGWWIGPAVAAALIAFHRLTGGQWNATGSAAAVRIAAGEWWRVVTALTLHAGPAHVLGNAVASVVFVGAVGRLLGAGVGLWAVLLAGAAGNAANALLRGPGHDSLGASTAVFAALGVLAGLQLVRRLRGGAGGPRPWMVIAASLALLGLLGTAQGADVTAHLFGLLAGAPIGAVAALLRPPGRVAQGLLAVAALAAVVACWGLALGAAAARR
jgi:membrane associated rhomboid family serine protease